METDKRRKDIRLKYYDYSRMGAYFVTVCTHKRQRLFGEISTVKENINNPDISAINEIDSSVGATLCGRPIEKDLVKRWLFEIEKKFSGVFLDQYVIMPDHIHFILFLDQGDHIGSPLQVSNIESNRSSLGQIVGWFKTMTTNEYVRNVKNGISQPFDKLIWQRGYYEHIIRTHDDLKESRAYIKNNLKKKYFESVKTNPL